MPRYFCFIGIKIKKGSGSGYLGNPLATTWMDYYGHGLHKSAFAPVFNSAGEISFLLGLDLQVPELESFEDIMVE